MFTMGQRARSSLLSAVVLAVLVACLGGFLVNAAITGDSILGFEIGKAVMAVGILILAAGLFEGAASHVASNRVRADYQLTLGMAESLEGKNLAGLDLSGLALIERNLAGANLRDTSLDSSDLEGANLSGTNMTGASLNGANLDGAILVGMKWDPASPPTWPEAFVAPENAWRAESHEGL